MEGEPTKREALEDLTRYEEDRIRRAYPRAFEFAQSHPDAQPIEIRDHLGVPEFNLPDTAAFLSHTEMPLTVMMGLYTPVIVPIPPLSLSERNFQLTYGMNIDQFAHYAREGKILPIVDGNPMDFVGKDFADPLLELRPPTIGLAQSFLMFNPRAAALGLQAEQMAAAIKDTVVRLPKPRGLAGHTPESIANAFERDSWELSCFGHENLVLNGLDVYPDIWLYLTVISNTAFFLTRPHVSGLGCTALVSERLIEIGLHSGVAARKELAYPYEVGKILSKAYDLPLPTHLDYDVLDDVYRSNSFSEARTLVNELVRATRAKKWDSARSCADRVGMTFRRALLELPALDKRVKKARWLVSATGYVVTGLAGAAIAGLPGVLASFGYYFLDKTIADRVGPQLGGIGSAPLTMAIWKFENAHSAFEGIQRRFKRSRDSEPG